MPSIKVYSMKTIITKYFERPTDVAELPKGKRYGTSQGKIIVPGEQVTGDVQQTLDPAGEDRRRTRAVEDRIHHRRLAAGGRICWWLLQE